MGQAVSRRELQKLSEAKIADANLLFLNERWSSCYYLAGYSVEMALKACAAQRIAPEAIPDKKFVTSLYTHNYDALIGLAGLRADLRIKTENDLTFAAFWGIASEWAPDVRYETTDKSSAHFLLNALQHQDHGVLPWIRTFW